LRTKLIKLQESLTNATRDSSAWDWEGLL